MGYTRVQLDLCAGRDDQSVRVRDGITGRQFKDSVADDQIAAERIAGAQRKHAFTVLEKPSGAGERCVDCAGTPAADSEHQGAAVQGQQLLI